MTTRRTRRILAALCVFALLVAVTTPAYASTNRSMHAMMSGSDPVAPTMDLLILRPLGLFGLLGGICLFVVTTPITLITRPHEIGTPFKELVVRPAKYVWADPIGQH
jgi:hypothetical protein